MADVTSDQVVEAAKALGPQFTRAELASKLDVKGSELKAGVKEARQSGRLEKVGDDDQGRGVFKLAGE